MGCSLGYHRGGIFGLLRVLDEHGEAIRFDLFMAGRSLDDLGAPGFSWLDLRSFVRNAPPTTAYFRAVHGDDVAAWASHPEMYLLATVADLLANGNWQRAGKQSAAKPKPIKRPGVDKRIGGRTVMELDELDKFMGWSPRH